MITENTVSKSKAPWFALGLIVLVVIVGGVLFRSTLFPKRVAQKYQAVFLTSGQAYFGKLKVRDRTSVLSDVYYISSTGSGTEAGLIKLGDEVFEPENEITINNASISYYENLKADSQVVKAITGQK